MPIICTNEKKIIFWRLLVIASLLLVYGQLKPQSTPIPSETLSTISTAKFQINENRPFYQVAPYFQILKDKNFSIEALMLPAFDSLFLWKPLDNSSFISAQIYWARLELTRHNTAVSNQEDWVLLFPNDSFDIEYYLVSTTDTTIIERKGQIIGNVQNREWIHKGYALSLPVRLKTNEPLFVYLKIEPTINAKYSDFRAILLPKQQGISTINAWANLLCIGAMLVLCVYNLLFFFLTRDKSYIFYGLYLLSNASYIFYVWMRLDTYLAASIMPDNPGLLDFVALQIFPGVICYTFFLQSFLETKIVLPKWHIALNGIIMSGLGLGLGCLFILASTDLDNRLATLIMAMYILGSSLLGLIMTIPFFKTGDKKAYFFIVGLLLFCSGVFLAAYTFFRHGRSPMFLFYFQLGAILEVICFSLGLGFKQLISEREKQKTKLALATSKMNREKEHTEALRLQELNQLKTRFFTNITHEFRTPLTIILGMAEQKDHPQAIPLIRQNGQRLLHLINQILDLSKLDAGHLKPDYQQIEIASFTQYIGESFQSLADKKYIRLSIYSEINELWLDMDEEKYRQIVSNLLSNAIKFTPESGKIVLHLFQKDEQLYLKITDNGIGIPKSELPFIFDRFYQVENTHSQLGKGTGVGLALVKELVELMNGSIKVESEVGKKTVFTIQLPIHLTASNRLTQFENIKIDNAIIEKEIIESEKNKEDFPKLLIVEDNPDVIIYIQSFLSKQYDIQLANNGEAGIQRAIEVIPDIIISDVMMPKKDGFELVTALKQDERTSHIPIILLTAKATQQDKLVGLKFGADAYLMKPFDKEELLIRLEKLLVLRQQLQEKYVTTSIPKIIPQKEKTLDDIFLEKFHAVLECHYKNEKLNVKQISEFLQMTYLQLNRKLKALTNKTPAKYLQTFRLEKAKTFLIDSANHQNVSEIAYEVGFTDPNYFSRSFRALFGQSPNSIRQ